MFLMPSISKLCVVQKHVAMFKKGTCVWGKKKSIYRCKNGELWNANNRFLKKTLNQL